jgi:hypothetical protein
MLGIENCHIKRKFIVQIHKKTRKRKERTKTEQKKKAKKKNSITGM